MKPLILVTNDDGIHSPGLRAAAEALSDLGDILVAAPHTQQTSMGRAFPRTADRGIVEPVTDFEDMPQVTAWAVHGSPAIAVSHGILELAARRPDLVVAGINYGENLGQTVTCSGTMGAALEAYSQKIPSVAISLETDPETYYSNLFHAQNWESSKASLRMWAQWMLSFGGNVPAEILNINVPAIDLPPEHYRITSLSRQNYIAFLKPEPREFSEPMVIPSRVEIDHSVLESDSDIHAVALECVTSVTPIRAILDTGWNCSCQRLALPG